MVTAFVFSFAFSWLSESFAAVLPTVPSRTVGIIRQGPGKLLDYLEEIIGTIGLRRQIEDLRQQESEHRCATAKVSVPTLSDSVPRARAPACSSKTSRAA